MTKRKDSYSCRACGKAFKPSKPHEAYCGIHCRLWSRVQRRSKDQCWEWNGAKNDVGYGQVVLDGKVRYAHRVVYELTNGVRLRRSGHVLHTCDNPACCNPDHLLIGTQKDNMADMWDKQRGVLPGLRGIDHPKAKLTEEQVLDIRKLIASGCGTRGIAKSFGVSQGAIEGIARGKNWKHI